MLSSSSINNSPRQASVPFMDQGGLVRPCFKISTILWNPDDDGYVPFVWCNLHCVLDLWLANVYIDK
jgi:hypothetical protein